MSAQFKECSSSGENSNKMLIFPMCVLPWDFKANEDNIAKFIERGLQVIKIKQTVDKV